MPLYIYIYIYMCVCVCVCACVLLFFLVKLPSINSNSCFTIGYTKMKKFRIF